MNLFFLLALAVARAQAGDPEFRAQVLTLLSGIEDPATEADWQALGGSAGAALLDIAKDASLLPTQRGNALVALGYFPSDDARALLSGLVRDEAADSLLRRKACFGLARGYGDAALTDLGVALASPDVLVRGNASRAMGEIGSAAAKEALTARLAVESNASVRDTISRALAGKE